MSNVILQGPGTDLTVLEKLIPADLFAENGTQPVFDAISKEVSTFVADVTTDGGRKEIAALAYKIAQSKNFLDKVGKAFNADLKAKTKAVDNERSAIWDKLEALQQKVRAPLTEWEAAEESRQQAHKDAIAEIEALPMFPAPPSVEQVKTALARGRELAGRDWQEHSDMATEICGNIAERLGGMLATAEQGERDRQELEALRAAKAEQEAKDAEAARQKTAADEKARIEREAAEKATRDAEAAIQTERDRATKAEADAAAAAKAADEKAARDKADADERVRKAEEARIAAEAKAKLEADAAVKAEKDRAAATQKKIDDDAKARENDRKHHAKINNEVLKAIHDLIGDEGEARRVVEAIAKGQVPHTKISY